MSQVVLDGGPLSISDVVKVAQGALVSITPEAKQRANQSRAVLQSREASRELIYGVNTGFGPLKSERISESDRVKLQENLIASHAVGVGQALPQESVRAAMLLLAASHLRGHSGVGPEAAELICELLNKNELPHVPAQGSLGASGDLAPLAHIALFLQQNKLQLYSKMGLALINGTHFHTGIAVLIAHEALALCKAADIACAMNAEAMLCSAKPFLDKVHELRPHQGQRDSAQNIERLLAGSELVLSHRDCQEVQDAYSIRCAPQVHGVSRTATDHLSDFLSVELSSVTDNPLVIGEEVISAGHFHGQPIAAALDYFKIGISALANVSERRTERVLNKDLNRGLPAFLTEHPGLNSGMMICQYTAAALVAENKVLSHPSSVDSIPTGANQEDHVSMAMNAALHAQRVLENVRRVLKIELLVAAQALDCRASIQSERPGAGVIAAWEAVRTMSPKLEVDRSLHKDIEELSLNTVIEAVESQIGALL
ncbi:MAG: aromatic amino acid lyase [Candidatus Nitrosotenuis sp.]